MIGSRTARAALLLGAATLSGCSLFHDDPSIETPVGDASLASWVVVADVEPADDDELILTRIEPVQRLPHADQVAVPAERLEEASLEALNATGAAVAGDQLVLFLSGRTDDRINVQYAHDPATDAPAGSLGEVEATSGVTVAGALECLRERTGEATRLAALIAAVEEEQQDPGRSANSLRRCEEGAGRPS